MLRELGFGLSTSVWEGEGCIDTDGEIGYIYEVKFETNGNLEAILDILDTFKEKTLLIKHYERHRRTNAKSV